MLSKEDARVTVIMSAYNHEKYVERAIKSVLCQTYKQFTFLVADDCSTDKTREIILRYENEIDEIHLFDTNSGFGRNADLEKFAQTEYIAIINSDDYWAEDKLEKQVAYLDTHPECAACFTYAYKEDENGEVSPFSSFDCENRSRYEWIYHFFKKGNNLCHPSKLIRREVNEALRQRKYFNIFRQIPDFFMWIELLQEKEIYVMPERLVYFSWHNNENMSAATETNVFRHVTENTGMWFQEIKDMDRGCFIKAFERELTGKEIIDDIDLMCEKYFLLASANDISIQQAGILYFHSIAGKPEVYERLHSKYGFNNKTFYDSEVNSGFGKLYFGVKKERDQATELMEKSVAILERLSQNK